MPQSKPDSDDPRNRRDSTSPRPPSDSVRSQLPPDSPHFSLRPTQGLKDFVESLDPGTLRVTLPPRKSPPQK
jgi:hypothetical protein